MEHITLTYPHVPALLADLRSLGRNLHPQRFAALRGKKWLSGLHKALQDTLITPHSSGRLALRFEIFYGHAFKAPEKDLPSEIARFSVNDLRNQLPSQRKR
jgi:malonyl-CoA O-methyltransferase